MRHSAPRDITKLMIGEVYLADHRRPVDASKVRELAASIDMVGLQNPIIVRTVSHWVDPIDGELDGAYILVSGRHRLEAQRLRGETHIEAYISDLDDLHAELAEIDENLIRCNLSPAQEASAIGRRKSIYEALHPETKHGANKNGPSRQFGDTETDRFTTATAAATGKAERNIQRAAARAEALGCDLRAVEGTSLDKGVELDALVKLAPDERRKVIETAQAGEIVSARKVRDIKDTDQAISIVAAEEFANWLMERTDLSEMNTIISWLQGTKPKDVIAAMRRIAA